MSKIQHTIIFIILFFLGSCLAQTTIAVLDFDARGISQNEVSTLTDRFRDELTKTNQYTVIERGKMEEVLREQGFQQSGCTSNECVVEVGQLIGVQQMVGGSIGKVGSVFTLSVRIIDVESGKIIKVTNYDHLGDLGELLVVGIQEAVEQLITGNSKSIRFGEKTKLKSNTSYKSPTGSRQTGTITDIDGNVYQTIQIGNQVWMAENLKVTHYRNGEEITTGYTNSEWSGLSTGGFSIYNDDPSNANTYGNLYNWYAIDDSRNIAPEGWHVPTDAEWKDLEMYLGMSQSEANKEEMFRGTNEGSKLAGRADLWDNGRLKENLEFGTTGFTALPGGDRRNKRTSLTFRNGKYFGRGTTGFFWSATESSSTHAFYHGLYYAVSVVSRYKGSKRGGHSVRCVRD